jgi:hypothetical protein
MDAKRPPYPQRDRDLALLRDAHGVILARNTGRGTLVLFGVLPYEASSGDLFPSVRFLPSTSRPPQRRAVEALEEGELLDRMAA